MQWRSQTRAHPGVDPRDSYEHGRFPKRIWHIQLKNSRQTLNNLTSTLHRLSVWSTNGISLLNFFSHAKNSCKFVLINEISRGLESNLEDPYEFNAN